MINVYDTANQLEKDLRESQEYKDLQAVVAKVKADDATFAVYKKLRTLDEKVMKSLQEISQEASQYPLMMELMEKERAISVLIDDLNKIIFKPLSEVYDIEG